MKIFLVVILAGLLARSGNAAAHPPQESVMSRFLRYVKIDTQSAEDQSTVPSTPKQMEFAKLLAQELKDLGVPEVTVSEFAIVYAKLPGNLGENRSIPVLGLMAHMDTSPDVSGANVKAIIHTNYQGGDIVLPGYPTQIITVANNPELKTLIGDDIITADGTTLLGSDDKAGCAEIMTLVDLLRENPEIKHGPLAIAFTPDEEVGGGIEKFDLEKFGARHAYTVDGKGLGKINDETWNAKSAVVTFKGKNTHPGTAKGILVNSLYAAGDFLGRFPTNALPETTEGRIGFLHPTSGKMEAEESTIKVILRDFDRDGLEAKEALLRDLAHETQAKFPNVKVSVSVRDDYQNMNEVLKNHPHLVENAFEATRRAGIVPVKEPIRGGTDGARLTFKGLPCPNLFTGGHNFHGKLEFNSRRGLEKTTEMLLHLVRVFAEKQ
jgi:tripeptide aminopeptidase